MTEESLQVFIEKMGYLINSDGTNEFWYKKAKILWNAIYKILCQYVNLLIRKENFFKVQIFIFNLGNRGVSIT